MGGRRGSLIDSASATGFLVLKQSCKRDLCHYYRVVCELPGIIKREPALQRLFFFSFSFLLREQLRKEAVKSREGLKRVGFHQRLGSDSVTSHITASKLAQRQFSFSEHFSVLQQRLEDG